MPDLILWPLGRYPSAAEGWSEIRRLIQVEHLALETDAAVQISVVRRGSGKGKISFQWHTENVSVLPVSYLQLSGEITMGEGVMNDSIVIEIKDNDSWNIEALQLVHLLEPQNCVLVTPLIV